MPPGCSPRAAAASCSRCTRCPRAARQVPAGAARGGGAAARSGRHRGDTARACAGAASPRLGCLREDTAGRAGGGTRLPGALHPSHGHRQRAARGHRRPRRCCCACAPTAAAANAPSPSTAAVHRPAAAACAAPGFKRIRHYGLLAPAAKTQRLALARAALQMPAPNPQAPRGCAGLHAARRRHRHRRPRALPHGALARDRATLRRPHCARRRGTVRVSGAAMTRSARPRHRQAAPCSRPGRPVPPRQRPPRTPPPPRPRRSRPRRSPGDALRQLSKWHASDEFAANAGG